MKAYFITGNRNKAKEIQAIANEVSPNIEIDMLPLEKIEIQDIDTRRVAAYAAAVIAAQTNERPILLEDTGLYLDALDGFPGAFIKWVLEAGGNELLLKMLGRKRNRSATYRVTVACVCSNERRLTFDGGLRGKIPRRLSGGGGIGFAKSFFPEGYEKLLAEMSE